MTTTGTAASSIYLPNSPPLIGVVFYHQMVPLELGPAGIAAITSTNALQLTIGSL